MNAYKSAHGFGLCSSQTKLRINRIRTANFKQLDIDKTLTHKLCKFMG